MNSARKKILLEKFFNDNCSLEELDELLNSYQDLSNQQEDEEIIEDEMQKVLAKLEDDRKLNSNKSEFIFNRILEQRDEEVTGKKFYSGPYLKVAASFIGLLLISGVVYFLFSKGKNIRHETAYGQTKEIKLPDGSTVVLNSNSVLNYLQDWENNEPREVELKGEAFFKVVHTNNNQKFLVKTSGLNVEVLGTEFNVLSRKNRSQVVLNSGRVKLNIKEKQPLVMKPGEIVELNADEKLLKKSSVNPEVYSSWKDNVLTFEATSLAEIVVLLEENYGKKVIVKDELLLQEQITGRFPVDEDIDLLVKMLSKAFHCKTSEKDGYIIFEN